MKACFALIVLLVLAVAGVDAQRNNQLAVQLSYDLASLSYQRDIFQSRLLGEIEVGIANQDIDSKFNDLLIGVRIGKPLLYSGHYAVNLLAGVGTYFSNNNNYSVVTPVYSGLFSFNRYVGEAKRHSFVVCVGYQYGKRGYKEAFKNEISHVTSTGEFNVFPLILSMGYGFHF